MSEESKKEINETVYEQEIKETVYEREVKETVYELEIKPTISRHSTIEINDKKQIRF